VLHIIIVGFSQAADAYAPRHRGRIAISDDGRFAWPMRLAAAITVCTYALAGIAKLRGGGIAWINGESLRNHVAYSAARLRVLGETPSPLAAPLMKQLWLLTPLALATLVIELGAPVVLFFARLRWLWVAAVVAMHAAIAATMFVVFPYPLTLIAFAPLFDLEQLPPRCALVARRLTRRPVTTTHEDQGDGGTPA
jgi:Vitamin K-dependent gamma-carboxylase